MRLILTILIIAITAAIAEWYGPWWSAAIVSGIGGALSKLGTGRAFIAGFCGIAIMWLAFALWRDIPNEHILSQRMARLFKLPSAGLYIAVTVLVGGIVGGLSAWAGAHLRKLFA